MKIGILTLPLHTNYGGILQAYALQTVLERMGHKVVIFDKPYHRILPIWKWPYSYPKRIVLKYVLHKHIRIFDEQYQNKIYPIISKQIRSFIDNYIHNYFITEFQSLKEKDYDVIIVGSDQVWRLRYFLLGYSQPIENAYLQFAKKWNIRRIAYAASMGTDKWEYSPVQTRLCGQLLQRFNAISVREKNCIRLCEEYFDVNDVQLVLDPTMLLEVNDYIHLFQVAHTPPSHGTLLYYILDKTAEKDLLIEKIASQKNLIPFSVNSNGTFDSCMKPSVEKWIRGFYDAEFIVTDSFHACVFSILFRKPFIVFGNEKRGLSRFYSLLSLFGLEDRLITNIDNLRNVKEIDYEKIYEKVSIMKSISIKFLIDSLQE